MNIFPFEFDTNRRVQYMSPRTLKTMGLTNKYFPRQGTKASIKEEKQAKIDKSSIKERLTSKATV